MRHLSVTADAVPPPLKGRLPLRGKTAKHRQRRSHLSAAFGGTSPQGEALGRLPLRGKPAKRRQRRRKRAGFEEAARLAGPPGAGNRFAATVWLAAKRD